MFAVENFLGVRGPEWTQEEQLGGCHGGLGKRVRCDLGESEEGSDLGHVFGSREDMLTN